MMRSFMLTGLLLALLSAPAAAIDWWWDYQANHPSQYADLPSDVKNAAGGNAFVLKRQENNPGHAWVDLGGGNWGWQLWNDQTITSGNNRYYWDGNDTGYQAYDPTKGWGYTWTSQFRIDSQINGFDGTKFRTTPLFLFYQGMTTGNDAKVRLNVSDHKLLGKDPITGLPIWGEAGLFVVVDDILPDGTYINFDFSDGQFHTIWIAAYSLPGMTDCKHMYWFDGVLVSDGEYARSGAYTSDIYFGWNERYGGRSMATFDYVKLSAQGAFDPLGNPVPEPGSLLALAGGLVGIAAVRRRR